MFIITSLHAYSRLKLLASERTLLDLETTRLEMTTCEHATTPRWLRFLRELVMTLVSYCMCI